MLNTVTLVIPEMICRLGHLDECTAHELDLMIHYCAPMQFIIQGASEVACHAKADTKVGGRSLQKFAGLNYVSDGRNTKYFLCQKARIFFFFFFFPFIVKIGGIVTSTLDIYLEFFCVNSFVW